MSRILLIGGSGQLGLALAGAFADAGELVTTGHTAAAGATRSLDLGDAEAVAAILEEVRPDLILAAGAMCNVDGCELDPDRCRRVNTLGPEQLAADAQLRPARLVFYSTDHVFDGLCPGPYHENDLTAPLSRYAASKLEAEETIRRVLPERHLIIRTGWVYGPDLQRRNFALRLVARLRAGETVTVPEDQFGCPTYTDDLARATRFLVDGGHTGTFHATGPDFVSRIALARSICDAFGEKPDGLRGSPTAALGQAARRSLRVHLSCAKLQAAGAPAFRGVDAGLASLAEWAMAAPPAGGRS